ncbi:hypothetical protein [Oryza sativa Japonica Group]|uniref:Uncharacterized protein n=1 Tax=Oryza sativa subsp. japonica TaxID=39947 RepID=Q5JNG6_ORYSJ|nr:hypothetical protein [Oryza sativa Japonica Group]BAD86992.1 hypothetical protein [Oryza sativa Japonica Group]
MGEGRGSIVEWLGILRIVEARDFCGEWGHETAGRRRLDEEDDALNAGKQNLGGRGEGSRRRRPYFGRAALLGRASSPLLSSAALARRYRPPPSPGAHVTAPPSFVALLGRAASPPPPPPAAAAESTRRRTAGSRCRLRPTAGERGGERRRGEGLRKNLGPPVYLY